MSITANPQDRIVVDRFQHKTYFQTPSPSKRPAGRLFHSALREMKFGAQQAAVQGGAGVAMIGIFVGAFINETVLLLADSNILHSSKAGVYARILLACASTATTAAGLGFGGFAIIEKSTDLSKTIGERRDAARLAARDQLRR